MVKVVIALAVASVMFTAQAATLFGAAVDKTAVLPVEQLLAQPQNYLDKVVTVSCKLDSVCSYQG